MGAGFYLADDAITRSSRLYCSKSIEEVFTRKEMSPEMNIRGKVREACDSAEHPESYPVIIGLDVTGSMGVVPDRLIKGAFPKIMKKLEENGLRDVQVCFLGIGDHYGDKAPIQVGQFESSDELTEKWLKNIYIEEGGGNNDGESYLLAWYFAAFHTKIDSFDKRGIKGTLITVGDEPCHRVLDKATVSRLFGNAEGDATASFLLEKAGRMWNIHHVNINDWASERYNSFLGWCDLFEGCGMPDTCVDQSDTTEEADICEVISNIIIGDYNARNGVHAPDVPGCAGNGEDDEKKHEL